MFLSLPNYLDLFLNKQVKFLLLILLFTHPREVYADAFAKPEMNFIFSTNNQFSLDSFEFIHLHSPDKNFSNFDTINSGYGFCSCIKNECRTTAYYLNRFHIIILKSDYVEIKSKIFEKRWENPVFDVYLTNDQLQVKNNIKIFLWRIFRNILISILISLLFEWVISVGFIRENFRKVNKALIITNLITVSSLWIVYETISFFFNAGSFLILISILEILVIIAEVKLLKFYLKDFIPQKTINGLVIWGNIIKFCNWSYIF